MMCINFILLLLVTINGCARTQLNVPHNNVSNNRLLPWIGVLRVSTGDGLVALTGIVLIHHAVAIGNAFDVSKITKATLRKKIRALFYDDIYRAWYYEVADYILHPEFEKNTVNTLAVVFLKGGKKTFKWEPIQWPKKEMRKYNSVFNIGYTDRKKVLEQILYKMSRVKQSDCIEFYEKEQIDFKIIWPTYYRCYKNKHAKGTCILDTGTALATNYTGTWELLGISIQGPGCSLPSRYIDVLPYVPWIKSKLISNTRRQQPKQSPQEKKKAEELGKLSAYSIDYEDRDNLFLAKISDTSMVLRPWLDKKRETIHGCTGEDGVISYRDFNHFNLPSPALGIYELTHLDTLFKTYNCVMMDVHNAEKSNSKFWFDKGFHQEDIGMFVKNIPIKKAPGHYPPRIMYVEDTWNKYEVYQTANLVFRFQVDGKSWFDVKFYGYTDITSRVKSQEYLIRPTPEPPQPRYIP